MRYLLSAVLFFVFSVALLANKIDDQIITPYVEVNNCGSGVCIKHGEDLYVLTAAHVVEDARQVVARTNAEPAVKWKAVPIRKYDDKTSKTWQCDVFAYSPPVDDINNGDDLALLKPRCERDLVAAKFKPDIAVETGQAVWYVGSPLLVHASLEKSIVNKTDEEAWNRRGWLMFNGNGTYGNSGGPVFVKHKGDYHLVGIVSMFRQTQDVSKSAILAVSHVKIAKFLEAAFSK